MSIEKLEPGSLYRPRREINLYNSQTYKSYKITEEDLLLFLGNYHISGIDDYDGEIKFHWLTRHGILTCNSLGESQKFLIKNLDEIKA